MKSDREIILETIRKSLSNSRVKVKEDAQLDSDINEKLKSITPDNNNRLIEQFKNELEKVNAEVILIEDDNEISSTLVYLFEKNCVNHIAISEDQTTKEISKSFGEMKISFSSDYDYPERKNNISQIKTALVFADYGIADIGSVVFSYDEAKTTYPHFLCDWTVILVKNNSIIANQFELMKNIDKEKAKNMVFVTGPSRTADIEKTLVLGAHGPRRVTIIIIP